MVLVNFQDIFDSLPQSTALNLPVYKENSLEINFAKNDEVKAVYSGSEPVLPFANSDVFRARLLCWKRLTANNDECKPVYELTFDVQDSNFSFKAGDTIGILPTNNETDINFIITHLDLTTTADMEYRLSTECKKAKIPAYVPVESTIRHVLTHCVDLRSVLKKLFLLALSRHTKDELERKILEYLCSKEGTTAYQNHVLNKNLCILDLFAIFKSCKPPIQVLLSNLPRLLPRPYSIVNSGVKIEKILKICFSVIPAEKNVRKGLTTGWLEELILKQCDIENGMRNLAINNCDNKISIYLRKNNGFCLPESMEIPLILIGPGTGVSPFLSFLQEREHYKNVTGKPLGEVWLFFGCRNPELDFIYEEQLKKFLEGGVLTELVTAFSRVENSKYKYIQDALKQNSDKIAKLIDSHASIYLCGDLENMAAQVKETLIQCLISSGKSIQDASDIISVMQKEKKYVVDAWS